MYVDDLPALSERRRRLGTKACGEGHRLVVIAVAVENIAVVPLVILLEVRGVAVPEVIRMSVVFVVRVNLVVWVVGCVIILRYIKVSMAVDTVCMEIVKSLPFSSSSSSGHSSSLSPSSP